MKRRPSGVYVMKNDVLGRMGNLETRLARTEDEVIEAQRLRYDVFYREMGAEPSAETARTQRDQDAFDACCDHLLVVETGADGGKKIVGTYRLMLESHRQKAGRFYSADEFHLDALQSVNQGRRFMELGRSCILPDYRSKRTMELLWHGNWAYAVQNKVDIMFGCASFQGTDPGEFAGALGWLHQNAVLNNTEDCTACTDDSIDLSALDTADIDARRALAKLPPLLKGYLRLGAKVASQAVIDRHFGTIDVLVVLKVADINPRYLAHYGADASRFAA